MPTLLLLVTLGLVACGEPARPLPVEGYGNRSPNIVNPSPVPLDQAMREVVRNYRSSSTLARAATRRALRNVDPFTLRDFALRAAVFAIREKKGEWIVDGLSAYAMLNDADDARMFAYNLALFHHAARRIRLDPAPIFENAARLAQPDVALVIREFAAMEESRKAIANYLLEELPTGFIYRGTHPFTPEHDLVRAIIDVAAILDRDRYEAVVLVIRTSFPETWVEGAEEELRNARGVASIETAPGQDLNVYIVEAVDDRAATSLLHAWRTASADAERPTLGITRGNLFCMVLSMNPEAMHETPQTLQRFAGPIEKVLDAALQKTDG